MGSINRPPVQMTEIDGVPAYWVESPGELVAGLLFRVGHADETLSTRGITHLIEHLALAGVEELHLPFNGAVGATTTTFVGSGSGEEVAAFFRGATRELASLPEGRFKSEARVLRAEAAARGTSLVSAALAVRYGAQHYGLSAFPELGLWQLDASGLDVWRRSWFTRENATLWLSGPPPDGIDLSALPRGERRRCPDLRPLDIQAFPCWSAGPPDRLAVVMALPRSAGSAAMLAVVGTRLRRRLRLEEGRSYEVSTSYEPMTADAAHGAVVADCLPDQAEDARDICIAELNQLALHGPTNDELEDHRQRARRAISGADRAAAQRQAFDALLGRADDADDVLELDRLTSNDLAMQLRTAMRTAVWIVPAQAGMVDRRIHAEVSSTVGPAPAGSQAIRLGALAPELADRLVFNEEQLSACWADGRIVTVRWRECVAVQHWADGARTVWGSDGFSIAIRPSEWSDHTRVLREVDAQIRPELIVTMDEALGLAGSGISTNPAAAARGSSPDPSTITSATALPIRQRVLRQVRETNPIVALVVIGLLCVAAALALGFGPDTILRLFVVAGVAGVVFSFASGGRGGRR